MKGPAMPPCIWEPIQLPQAHPQGLVLLAKSLGGQLREPAPEVEYLAPQSHNYKVTERI